MTATAEGEDNDDLAPLLSPTATALLAQAKALHDEAHAIYFRDSSKSLTLNREAIRLLEETTFAPTPDDLDEWHRLLALSRSLHTVAYCLDRQSHYDESIATSERSLAILEQLSQSRCEARTDAEAKALIRAQSDTLKALQNVHRHLGNYADSLEYCHLELRLQEEAGVRVYQVGTLNSISGAYFNLGDFDRAMETALQALALAQETQEAASQGQGSAWNNIGNVASRRGDSAAAMDAYDRAVKIFREIGDRYWEAGILGNYARVCIREHEYTRAQEMLTTSLRLREQVSDRQGQAHALFSLGDLYAEACREKAEELGELSFLAVRSLRFYKRALRLFVQVGERRGVAVCNLQIGALYSHFDRYERAAAYARAGKEMADELQAREILFEAHKVLSEICEKSGQYSEALAHYKQYHEAKETVFNLESEERLRNLETLHKVAQARKEAETQKALNEQLAAANAALRASDAEKSELLAQLRDQASLLEHQARTDALTGLLNRHTLTVQLSEAWERARQENGTLCIVLCDVDHFKQINDHFSHPVGDAVLRRLAKLFPLALRSTDIVARYGGEEFLLVLPGTHFLDTLGITERLRRLIAVHPWSELHPDLQVTVSMGICEASGEALRGDPEAALRTADDYMYEAKRAGRDRIHPTAAPAVP